MVNLYKSVKQFCLLEICVKACLYVIEIPCGHLAVKYSPCKPPANFILTFQDALSYQLFHRK